MRRPCGCAAAAPEAAVEEAPLSAEVKPAWLTKLRTLAESCDAGGRAAAPGALRCATTESAGSAGALGLGFSQSNVCGRISLFIILLI